jgi:hypothetical protein
VIFQKIHKIQQFFFKGIEVMISVSENFGGWGVEAKFDDMEALTLLDQ